ncbi:hypothetical protein SDC9_208146 [bioreactor metagenome]|uniref:Uncharacterized protein n=1 Tax=bioreactor metagenome TaxID=1076179 RepID=A0A645J9T8_9ZZZZ
MPKLKKTVSQLSQQDLNTIASAVGEDKLTQIMSAAKSVTNSDNKTQR